MVSEDKWLQEGEQTKLTPRIKKIAENLKKESEGNLEFLMKTLNFIEDNIKPDKSDKDEVFRKRTADKIIKDGYSTGCTDYALTFIAIARAGGIPTKYLEGVRGGMKHVWEIANVENTSINGHVIAESLVNGEWYAVETTRKSIGLSPNRVVCGGEFIVLWKALDSWDLGIKDMDELITRIRERAEEKI